MNGQNMKVMRKLDVWLDDYAKKGTMNCMGKTTTTHPCLEKLLYHSLNSIRRLLWTNLKLIPQR